MPRRNHGGGLGVPGRTDGDWLPRPRKDIDYDAFVDLPAEAERIKREIDGPAARARHKFRKAGWPSRRPALAQAQIGDVLAGNIGLRATCACGHSAPVDPALLAAKFAPSTRIVEIRRRVRCTQCRRYGTATLVYPESGPDEAP